MLSTSKNVLFPGHNHLLTTGADDLTLVITSIIFTTFITDEQRWKTHKRFWSMLWPSLAWLHVCYMVLETQGNAGTLPKILMFAPNHPVTLPNQWRRNFRLTKATAVTESFREFSSLLSCDKSCKLMLVIQLLLLQSPWWNYTLYIS